MYTYPGRIQFLPRIYSIIRIHCQINIKILDIKTDYWCNRRDLTKVISFQTYLPNIRCKKNHYSHCHLANAIATDY